MGDYIERERQREREQGRLEIVKTEKWYYLHNMRSAYFPFNKPLHREKEREQERETERETEIGRERDKKRETERCEMVKTQKQYYLCNMRSAYFPINRRLHRDRARKRERARVTERERQKEREM